MAPKKIPVRRTGRALAHLHSKPSPHMRLVPHFAGTLRSPQIEMRSAHGWRQPELHFGEARTRFPASHEPPGGASREPCAHLRSKCASRMGGGSRSFILARLELASRHPTNRLAALRGNPALTSDQNALRAWVEAASSRNRSPLQKITPRRCRGVIFCRVLTEKMQEQSLVSQGFAGF